MRQNGTANRRSAPTATILRLRVTGNPELTAITVTKGAGASIYSPSANAAALYVSSASFTAICAEFPNDTKTAPVSVIYTPKSDPNANCEATSFICDSVTYPC
jgi:hypothetical protein